MFFKTKSGSVYELDAAAKRIRRLHGEHPATNIQGKDGEWKPYHTCDVYVDYPAVIQWEQGLPRFTVTSTVLEIISQVKE